MSPWMKSRLLRYVTSNHARRHNSNNYNDDSSRPNRAIASADGRLSVVIDSIKDWQLTHGSLLKLVRTEEDHTVLTRPIGVSLYPTRFPRARFDEALLLQVIFNELYVAVAADEDWLCQALHPLLTEGSFAKKLWDVHLAVKEEGYVQEMSLGLFRSDYMLHTDAAKLKQVEFNTYSCAGIAHSSRVSAMHRHLCRTGSYEGHVRLDDLPKNDSVGRVVDALAKAHAEYTRQRGDDSSSSSARRTGVLVVVQPFNVNIADERPFEYGLWDRDIPAYHIVWGTQLLAHTSLTSTRELLFRPHSHSSEHVEITVVYHRAGYDEEEYDEAGVNCRLRLERSRAIKCPSVLAHLAGFKAVQHALSAPDALSRFLPPDKATLVSDTFMPMYTLDDTEGQKLATNPRTAANYVLKPSWLEGGGHNVFRGAIPSFLRSLSSRSKSREEEWGKYVLMELIRPPLVSGVLVGPKGIHEGPVESELGVVGVCLWRNHRKQQDVEAVGLRNGKVEVVMNEQAGFTLKTKRKGVDEMSVVKGYGCFDSPLLVD